MQTDEEHNGVGGRCQRGVRRRRNNALHINESRQYGRTAQMARGIYAYFLRGYMRRSPGIVGGSIKAP